MGRLIKFRALKDDMADFSFVYGDLIYDNGVPRIKVENCMLFTTCLKDTEGQFTGLLDKNGKEIYEGDIVKRGDGRTDNMIFADGEFKTENEGWSVDWLVNHRLGDMGEDIEIIGNIYETK